MNNPLPTKTPEVLVLVLLCGIFFWDISSYPAWFDHIVAQAIWPQVNHLIGGQPHPLQGVARWQWQDMYQHNAGLSPIYGGLIELGLQFAGLSLQGVRLPQALLSILVLGFAYWVLRGRVRQPMPIILAALLMTSPWFLVMMRSGGIIGLNGTLIILCLSLIALLFPQGGRNAAPVWLAIAAGLSVSLLPYGHSSLRLIAVVLAIGVPACYCRIGKKNAFGFLIGLLPLVLLQLTNFDHAASVFFLVRGESLWQMAKLAPSTQAAMEYVFEKLTANSGFLCRILLGLNDSENYLNTNIASSYWMAYPVLYPKFLVPFFLWGLALETKRILQEKSLVSIALFLLLILSLLPGLLSGLGSPNQARLFLAVIPIYAYIAIAMTHIYSFLPSGKTNLAVLAIAITLVAGYQSWNFFSFEKGAMDDKDSYASLVATYQQLRQRCPQAVVVLHEHPDFDVYSYVLIRWRGGQRLQEEIQSQKAILLTRDNQALTRQILETAPAVLVISQKASADALDRLLGDRKPPLLKFAGDELQIMGKGCPN